MLVATFSYFDLVKTSERPYGADSDIILMTDLQLSKTEMEKLNNLARNKKIINKSINNLARVTG